MFADEEVDRRIRDGLNRSAEGVELNALVLLREATGRGNRALRRRRQAFVLGCVTVVVAVAAVVAVPLMLSRHTAVQQADSPRAARLTGSLSRTVPAESGVVRNAHLAGGWTLLFSDRGTARIQAPSTFHGVQSGVSFLQQADRIRMDIFAQDLCAVEPVGSYRWVRGGDTVRFTNIDDSCAARIRLLTGGVWRHVP
jgi:hypothetical protein